MVCQLNRSSLSTLLGLLPPVRCYGLTSARPYIPYLALKADYLTKRQGQARPATPAHLLWACIPCQGRTPMCSAGRCWIPYLVAHHVGRRKTRRSTGTKIAPLLPDRKPAWNRKWEQCLIGHQKFGHIPALAQTGQSQTEASPLVKSPLYMDPRSRNCRWGEAAPGGLQFLPCLVWTVSPINTLFFLLWSLCSLSSERTISSIRKKVGKRSEKNANL